MFATKEFEPYTANTYIAIKDKPEHLSVSLTLMYLFKVFQKNFYIHRQLSFTITALSKKAVMIEAGLLCDNLRAKVRVFE
jgi:hypothetical protein